MVMGTITGLWRVLIMVLLVISTVFFLAGEANSSEFQDRYLISAETYRNVVPNRYFTIYNHVDDVDVSAGKAMVTAARETCLNTVNNAEFVGPREHSSHPAFDCYTRR